MNLDGRADSFKFLIRDRDTKFTAPFDAAFTAVSMRIIRTPVRAPRANAVAERWIASARRECLDRMLITSERHLQLVLSEYVSGTHKVARRGGRRLARSSHPDPRGPGSDAALGSHDVRAAARSGFSEAAELQGFKALARRTLPGRTSEWGR